MHQMEVQVTNINNQNTVCRQTESTIRRFNFAIAPKIYLGRECKNVSPLAIIFHDNNLVVTRKVNRATYGTYF